MDQWGQIGPEKGDYDADVATVADQLNAGKTVTFPLTHRGTKQQLVMVLEESVAVIGGGPVGLVGGPYVYVSREGQGAYWFRADLLQNPGYVQAHMNDAHTFNAVDAETVSEFLARLGSALGYEVSNPTNIVTVL